MKSKLFLICISACLLFTSSASAVVFQGQADNLAPPDSLLGSVGQIFTVTNIPNPGWGFSCSAQPIARDILITAAHCTFLETATAGKFSYDVDGNGVSEGEIKIKRFVHHPL